MLIITTGRDRSLTELEIASICRRYDIRVFVSQLMSDFIMSVQFDPQDTETMRLLQICLMNCSLVRYAFFDPIISSCSGIGSLLLFLKDCANDVELADIILLGRRMNSSKKYKLICSHNSKIKLVPSSSNELFIVADLHGVPKERENTCEYHLVKLFCTGGDKMLQVFERKNWRAICGRISRATGCSVSHTTRLDFTRCYLAANAALIGTHELVLDPFAGSCALPNMSELLGAVSLSSDVNATSAFSEGIGSLVTADMYCPPWTGFLDAIITDPPYDIRTAGLRSMKRKAIVTDIDNLLGESLVVKRQDHNILMKLLRLAHDRLVYGGRLAFWWFSFPNTDIRSQLEDLISKSGARGLEIERIGFDDQGLGNKCGGDEEKVEKSGCCHSETTAAFKAWRRCLVVMARVVGPNATSSNDTCSATRPIRTIRPLCTQSFACVHDGDLLRQGQSKLSKAKDESGNFCPKEKSIFEAAWRGDVRKLDELLAQELQQGGIASNICSIRDSKGNSPLIFAAGYGRVSAVEWFLAHDAVVDAASCDGSAVVRAARFGHADAVAALVRRGALLNVTDADGWTAAAHAIAFDHATVLQVLPRACVLAATMGSGGTPCPAHIAARWGALRSLQEIIAALGTPRENDDVLTLVNSSLEDGTCPLHLAARYGHLMFCRELITLGAKTDATDKYGHTPLFVARVWMREDIVCLLDSGAALSGS